MTGKENYDKVTYHISNWNLTIIWNQVTCSPAGNICAENIIIDKESCLIPCEGIYADVTTLKSSEIDET